MFIERRWLSLKLGLKTCLELLLVCNVIHMLIVNNFYVYTMKNTVMAARPLSCRSVLFRDIGEGGGE